MKKRTINCKAGFGEVKGDRLVIVAWRGNEAIHVRLEVSDYELLDLINKTCELASNRRRKHEVTAREIRETVQEAAGKV